MPLIFSVTILPPAWALKQLFKPILVIQLSPHHYQQAPHVATCPLSIVSIWPLRHYLSIIICSFLVIQPKLPNLQQPHQASKQPKLAQQASEAKACLAPKYDHRANDNEQIVPSDYHEMGVIPPATSYIAQQQHSNLPAIIMSNCHQATARERRKINENLYSAIVIALILTFTSSKPKTIIGSLAVATGWSRHSNIMKMTTLLLKVVEGLVFVNKITLR